MAETVPSLDLDRIERDLRDLVMPSLETIGRLVAETRRLRANSACYERALGRIDSIIHHATEETR